jgi:hypothetical protein
LDTQKYENQALVETRRWKSIGKEGKRKGKKRRSAGSSYQMGTRILKQIGYIKACNMIGNRFRNKQRRYAFKFKLVAGLVNWNNDLHYNKAWHKLSNTPIPIGILLTRNIESKSPDLRNSSIE